jgi:hypothetical protein
MENLSGTPLTLTIGPRTFARHKRSRFLVHHDSDDEKSFMTLTPGANVIKLFTAVNYEFS